VASCIASFAVSPLTAAAFPEITTAIAHLREVLGDPAYESPARQGARMSTTAIVTYAYDQIDQARAELNAVSQELFQDTPTDVDTLSQRSDTRVGGYAERVFGGVGHTAQAVSAATRASSSVMLRGVLDGIPGGRNGFRLPQQPSAAGMARQGSCSTSRHTKERLAESPARDQQPRDPPFLRPGTRIA
jgi:hypothetical protein